MKNLLSRYAECVYWMARYIERAEGVARVLDVNETFSRTSQGGQDWSSVLELYADRPRFLKDYPDGGARQIVYFYTLDPKNPGSILSSVRAARENARTLRPLISTEMWIQLNVFFNELRERQTKDISEPLLSRFCSFVKEHCQTHVGITEGTFYRDESWRFYLLGQALERADQTTRLLDVKYHLLLPSADAVGTPLDTSRWNTLLRTVAAYHAFRRIHPAGMTPAMVVGFLLFNRRFPRAVLTSVDQVSAQLKVLAEDFGLDGVAGPLAEVERLRGMLETKDASRVLAGGLHEFADQLQSHLIEADQALAKAFFA